MVQEAQSNAAQDVKRREMVDARNGADNLIYSVEKSLRDAGDKVNGAQRATAEAAINDLRDAVKSDDLNRIKRATDALQQAASQIGSTAAEGNSKSGGESTENSEGVVEGEYRHV